ncbi:hypothetical protein BH11PSE1_BH11PSE1_15220 [soil metagenome]
MTDIDEAIRQSLSAEDVRFLEAHGGEQPLLRQVLQTLTGSFAPLNAGGWIAGFALFAVGAFCVWRFLNVTELRDLLLWGGGAMATMLGLTLIKVWFWMEMQKNAIVREVKRLELQLARLAGKPGGAPG